MSKTIPIYRPGSSVIPYAIVTNSHGGSHWPELRKELSEIFEVDSDDISAPDLYFGGDYGDDNRIDAVVVNGIILATLDIPVTIGALAEIYANPANSHAKLAKPKLEQSS